MGLPTPEPEQSRRIADSEETAAESSRSASAVNISHAEKSPVPADAPAHLPSRALRTARQSIARPPAPPRSDTKRTLVTSNGGTVSKEDRKVPTDIIQRKARTSTGSGKKIAEHGAALLNSALVRGREGLLPGSDLQYHLCAYRRQLQMTLPQKRPNLLSPTLRWLMMSRPIYS